MVQVIRFCEDPLVEGKPGELAIDEACLGVEVDRPDLDRLRVGAHYCSPVGAIAGLAPSGHYPSGGSLSCHRSAPLGRGGLNPPPHMARQWNSCNRAVGCKARMVMARRGGRS